ncbi:MAG: hypothetical protein RIR00_1483 [Pseudomonadota bacterium]|jgi:glycosyltransferase involved in cell wall biosynthesis
MTKSTPLISIVTPCFNEEENVEELFRRTCEVFATLPDTDFEHIFIDNASSDRTVEVLRAMAARDPRVRVIVNNRNFGHIRSPFHAYLQARGDAIIAMVADLQDPPELIADLISKWREGYKVAICTKPTSRESLAMSLVRKLYYRTAGRISDVDLIPNFCGFGIYDREVIEQMRRMDDPYPYFRGLIAEFGYTYATIPFDQPRRYRGITKNNFYSLFDTAMLGITSHSKVPIRVATLAGFTLSALSMTVALVYLIAKLIYWDSFALGTTPILVGVFFFASVQLFFIGILGEYIAAIHTQVLKRPHVVEKERINFD